MHYALKTIGIMYFLYKSFDLFPNIACFYVRMTFEFKNNNNNIEENQ